MEIVELITELAPIVLSLFATIVAFMKGKTKKIKILSDEEKTAKIHKIADKADKKYSAYVEKQCKKNNIDNVAVVKASDVALQINKPLFDETEV